MNNENEERTERVYQRVVTISFDTEQPDREERRERVSRIQQALANRGIRLMDSDWQTTEPTAAHYGLKSIVNTTTIKTLRFGKAVIVMPSTVTTGEIRSITQQLDEQYATVTLDEATTTENREVWQVRSSEKVWVNIPMLMNDANCRMSDSGLEPTLGVSKSGLPVTATVKVSVNRYSGTVSMSISLSWETDRIMRTADIKQALTDVPEQFVAMLQANFTTVCEAFGIDVSEPTFDCDFTANIETVSKCEPDIITQMNKARQAQL